MLVIRDKNGKVIQSSQNLRGIREYVGKTKSPISCLAIDLVGQWEGKIFILFDDVVTFETDFTSFKVLKDFVRRWRNVYGAPLRVNGLVSGMVEYRNVALQ